MARLSMAQAVATAIVVAVVVAAVLPAACDAVRPKKRSQMGKAERKAQQNLCHGAVFFFLFVCS